MIRQVVVVAEHADQFVEPGVIMSEGRVTARPTVACEWLCTACPCRHGTAEEHVVRFALHWQRGTEKHRKSAVKDTGKYRPGKRATRPAKHHFCVRPSGYSRAPKCAQNRE